MRETSTTAWQYTGPKELYSLMKSSKVPGKDYVVVDVRDEDFVGGNIRGCLHIPSQKYEELFNELYTKVKDIPTVIFHCAYSQARGPRAANIYTRARMSTNNAGNDTLNEQQVLVLQGGFAVMQAMYKDDETIIEGWDKAVWEYDFF